MSWLKKILGSEAPQPAPVVHAIPPIASAPKFEPLHIVAYGICTSVGHYTPAAICALRAGMDHFRESGFKDRAGQPLLGAALYEVPYWGKARFALMLERVLADCREQLNDWDTQNTALLLLSSSHTPLAQGAAWCEAWLGQQQAWHAASQCLPLGKAGIAQAVLLAQEMLAAPNAGIEKVCILGVDSLLQGSLIDHLLKQRRLLTSGNSDGFIPGEGAGAIVLARQATSAVGCAITAAAHAQEPVQWGSEQAQRAQGLVQAVRAATSMVGCKVADLAFQANGASGEQWYSRENALALGRVLEHRVAEFPQLLLAKYLGETGAAAGPITLGWLAVIMPRNSDSPGRSGLVHFANDDGLRAALIIEKTPQI